MRRLILGGVLASTLLAQPLDQRVVLAQGSGASRVVVMPPPSGRPLRAPPDGTVTQMPAPTDETDSNDVITAPPPEDNRASQAPFDNSVTSAPLPPAPSADDQAESPMEVVPNPLDTANAPPASGAPAPSKGQAVPGAWVKMGTATLQALDKVNAIEKTMVVKVGDTGRFASLDIAVRGCFVRSSDRPADATAFLVIRDQRSDAPAFNGWMVRSAPYMSMMAHPLYDVRIAGCSP